MGKLTKQKKINQNTFRSTRHKEPKLHNISDIPEPYECLNPDLYYKLATWVKENGVMADIDYLSISMCANSLHIYSKAVKEVDTKGAWENYQKGSNVTGFYTVMNREMQNFFAFSKKFGLDQESREKLLSFAVKEEKDEENPFEKI